MAEKAGGVMKDEGENETEISMNRCGVMDGDEERSKMTIKRNREEG